MHFWRKPKVSRRSPPDSPLSPAEEFAYRNAILSYRNVSPYSWIPKPAADMRYTKRLLVTRSTQIWESTPTSIPKTLAAYGVITPPQSPCHESHEFDFKSAPAPNISLHPRNLARRTWALQLAERESQVEHYSDSETISCVSTPSEFLYPSSFCCSASSLARTCTPPTEHSVTPPPAIPPPLYNHGILGMFSEDENNDTIEFEFCRPKNYAIQAVPLKRLAVHYR